MIANRQSRRPPDLAHPFGHGREAYVWSLFAALGLFVAGATVSVTHGIRSSSSRSPLAISRSAPPAVRVGSPDGLPWSASQSGKRE